MSDDEGVPAGRPGDDEMEDDGTADGETRRGDRRDHAGRDDPASEDAPDAPDREGPASNPARPHPCHRCGATIGPGHVYGALDLLDADGALRVLLCRSCAADLRAFLDGEAAVGDRERGDRTDRD